jgi:hypothetical protein
MILVLMIGGIWFASYAFTRSFRGPEFLVFYALALIVLWLLTVALRHFWKDYMMVSVIGCVVFVGIGIVRFVTGLLAGMGNFLFLFIMMGLGGLLFFMRAKNEGGYGVGGSCAVGGCGGGSCGGGGCGGGCGGCGGS